MKLSHYLVQGRNVFYLGGECGLYSPTNTNLSNVEYIALNLDEIICEINKLPTREATRFVGTLLGVARPQATMDLPTEPSGRFSFKMDHRENVKNTETFFNAVWDALRGK